MNGILQQELFCIWLLKFYVFVSLSVFSHAIGDAVPLSEHQSTKLALLFMRSRVGFSLERSWIALACKLYNVVWWNMYGFLLGPYVAGELWGHRFTSTQFLKTPVNFPKRSHEFHTHQQCTTCLVYTHLYSCLVFSVIFILVLWLVCDIKPSSLLAVPL